MLKLPSTWDLEIGFTYREARRLLDQMYQENLETSRDRSRPVEDALPPPSSPPLVSPTLPANRDALEVISPFAFLDVLTEQIFPDTPPLTLDSSVISIPFFLRKTPSPTNSTDNVKFLEEIPPPPPRFYFRIQENDSFESLDNSCGLSNFPEGTFTIRPRYFDP